MFFECSKCLCVRELTDLANLPCSCLLCRECVNTSLLQLALEPYNEYEEGDVYEVGEVVMYFDKVRSQMVEAKVVQVDRCIHPPQFGIELLESDNFKYTEKERLRKRKRKAGGEAISSHCPSCLHPLTCSDIQNVAPRVFDELSDQATKAWMRDNNIIRCPGCSMMLDRKPANQNGHQAHQGHHGNGVRAADNAAQHKTKHEVTCTMCRTNFCDTCYASPYHAGYTCEQHAAPSCLYCGAKNPSAKDASQLSPWSTTQLQEQLAAAGVDASWCVEKGELRALLARVSSVCTSASCRQNLGRHCMRMLPCGHWCCSVRHPGYSCLPCIDPACGSSNSAASSSNSRGAGLRSPHGPNSPATKNCCFCLDPLSTAPCIQLGCKHVCHLECAEACLKAGFPGPEISFNFLFCPLCGTGEGRSGNIQAASSTPHLNHDALAPLLEPHLQLREQVATLAKLYLRQAGQLGNNPELQHGGKYDGRPVDYALSKFSFYQCHQCRRPYCGGMRACGQQDGREFDPSELLCGQCSAKDSANAQRCEKHGLDYIHWKCRYCCNTASWFCWGTTHMCHDCHEDPSRRSRCAAGMCDPTTCHLRIPHTQPGSECCLGCSMCWAEPRA